MDDKKKPAHSESQVIIPNGYIPFSHLEDDTVDLGKLIRTLLKRKGILFSTIIAALLSSFAYIYFTKPVYEAKVTLEIGKELIPLKDGSLVTKYFDSAKRLKQSIDIKYDTKGKYREKGATAYIKRVETPKKSDGFITIVAYGNDNGSAVSLLEEPIKEIMADHMTYYNSLKEKKNDTIHQLQKQIDYNLNTVLPQLKTSLQLLQTIELDKIKKRLDLIRSIDLKKIDKKIEWIKTEKIPAIKKKILETETEIGKKEKSISTMQEQISKIAHSDPALAAMSAMQVATLQNDVSRLRMRLIDFRSEIKKLEEETIPDLKKEKTRILETKIPNLEAEKVRLEKETIPAKASAIKKIESITIPQLESTIKQIRTSMEEPYLVMTKILGKIYTQEEPVKPKKRLVIAGALIAGTVLGVILILLIEFIGKKPEEESL